MNQILIGSVIFIVALALFLLYLSQGTEFVDSQLVEKVEETGNYSGV